MATINIGRLKPVFQGAYDNAQGYVVDDIVTYSGETYICILASTGNVPTNTTYWSKMASKGADGVDADLFSISGTAQGDLYYNNGSAIARLGAGTSGQALITQGTGANPIWGNVSAISKEFKAYNNTSQSVTQGVELKLIFDGEAFDEDNVYDTSTGRYSPNEAGIYFISGSLRLSNGGHSDTDSSLRVKKNGGNAVLYGQAVYSNAYYAVIAVNGLVKLTSSSDYLELWHNQRNNNVSTYVNNNEDVSFFSGFKIS